MAWVKLHTDILGDRRLMEGAASGLRGLELLPWFMAFARRADDRGRLTVAGAPADPEDVASGIPGATPGRVAIATLSLLKIRAVQFDSDGALRIANRYWRGARRAIPRAIRDAVWARDGGRCVECRGAEHIEFDHIHPHSLGGPETVDNLQLLCRRCNRAKGARVPSGAR